MSPGDRLGALLEEHETWLRVERGLAPNSLAAYRADLRRYESFLRRRHRADPDTVDEALVAAYVRSLTDARDDDGHRRYAPASIARALSAVRSFHRFCVEEGVAADPSSDLGRPRVPQGIPKALAEDEVEALLDGLRGDDARSRRDRALLEVLYGGGLRISEAVGLDLADLDRHDGLLRVLGKGSKERVVPVGRGALGALDDYLDHGRGELARPGRPEPAVFLNTRGRRLSRQGAWSVVRKAGERTGLGDHVHPHVLRHSCATHMLDHGADIRVVQELLGHASLSTTQVYTKVSAERLRAVYEAAHPRARARTGSAR